MKQRGLILVISGPSGSGKGSIIKPYMTENPDCQYSVSITTRPPRNEDIDGVTYHFKSKDEVERMIKKDELLEWDMYCENYYGTPASFIEDAVSSGNDCILEITVPGAINVKKKLPECVMIFIAPPDIDELRRRITDRGTEDQKNIDKRMDEAIRELKMVNHYDYVIINRDVDTAISELKAIIKAEKVRYDRCKDTLNKIGFIQED